MPHGRAIPVLSVLVTFLSSPAARAYAPLTHEAIIDSAWKTDIEPRLQRRFPNATAEDLRKAHAYTYGGCIIQDMGYYPFGSKFFSDLVHYVRSGDFVAALFAQSQTLEEYAFAFGALAHYAADINGHAVAINRAVPIEYPKLAQKFGSVVTYEDSPSKHIKTEFGFDVVQVARGRYAPQSYHDFIGFEVAKDLLDRAFHQVYALHMDDVFVHDGLAFSTYRRTVSTLIPEATKIAWKMNEDKIQADQPGITRGKFLYNLSRASYEKEWGRDYHRPGVWARTTAVILRVLPKVGPFKALAFKPPSQQTTRMFELSFNQTLDQYRAMMRSISGTRLDLTDLNLDTGEPVTAGKYRLADRAYARLVEKLAERDFAGMPEDMRRDILAFYRHAGAGPAAAESRQGWQKTMAALNRLRAGE